LAITLVCTTSLVENNVRFRGKISRIGGVVDEGLTAEREVSAATHTPVALPKAAFDGEAVARSDTAECLISRGVPIHDGRATCYGSRYGLTDGFNR